jgi:hypothetical protein
MKVNQKEKFSKTKSTIANIQRFTLLQKLKSFPKAKTHTKDQHHQRYTYKHLASYRSTA